MSCSPSSWFVNSPSASLWPCHQQCSSKKKRCWEQKVAEHWGEFVFFETHAVHRGCKLLQHSSRRYPKLSHVAWNQASCWGRLWLWQSPAAVLCLGHFMNQLSTETPLKICERRLTFQQTMNPCITQHGTRTNMGTLSTESACQLQPTPDPPVSKTSTHMGEYGGFR